MSLELRDNNLYANGVVLNLANNSSYLERFALKYTGALSDKQHTIIQGDTLTALAYKYYKNISNDPAKYWWVLADVNTIDNPLDISELIGSDIVIPDLVLIKLNE